jgi:hypothetical protein
MDVLLVGGTGEVAAAGASESVPAGQMTTVALDENGLATTAPTTATAYDATRIQYVPFNLLPETIDVPATAGWVNTGITLNVGQQFTISASGMVTSCLANCSGPGWDIWVSPVGMPLGDACPAGVDGMEIPPEIDLCQCQGVTGTCIIQGATLMALTARIGGGAPFIVGPGGSFTAQASGELYLSVNDDDFSDNGGAFTAIVTVMGRGENAGAPIPAGCAVSTPKTTNLHAGPGTNYDIAGQLAPGTYGQVIGQTQGADGFVWWQLADNTWARSDVVNESGSCGAIPEVSAP